MDPHRQRALVRAEKPELVILDTEELNAETPVDLLDSDITPVERLFVRNTGTMPAVAAATAWTFAIDGCVRLARTWTLPDLARQFATVTEASVLECAGNGRAFFSDPAGTVLWRHGAAGCVAWTGVRLADVLDACGVLPAAVYTAHHSPDLRLDGRGPALSRGVPIAKALAPETLLCWAANGAPLPALHGGPLRLIVPGFPGSASQKWITRLEVRDREHDGERMRHLYYRLPRRPLRYGDPIDPEEFDVITDMPPRAIITSPRAGHVAGSGRPLAVRGFAWSGHVSVATVEVSPDGGRAWRVATLAPVRDRFAWRRFETMFDDLPRGPFELVARTSDADGRAQPLASASWNPRGYCNNTVHRLTGLVR